MKINRSKILSPLLLLFTAMIWGSAFVAQSVGSRSLDPWTFVFSRYVLSSLVLLPVTLFSEKRTGTEEKPEEKKTLLKGALFCGFFLGLASIAQQAGIRYTTAGKAGFITTLYVVMVPLISFFLGRKPERKTWLCTFLGLTGLYLISVKENFTIGKGDALVILCALLFSFQIICVGYYSARVRNVVKLSNLQFLVASLVVLPGMLLSEKPSITDICEGALPVLYAGIFSGAIGYTLQVVAQKNTDPAVASLIMSMESVFAAITGWIVLGQSLSPRETAGCAILFIAVILSELPFSLPERRHSRNKDGN